MAYPGQTIDNPITGERIVFQKTAAQTGGRLLTFDLFLTPGGHVPAGHVHPALEERFTIQRGRVKFRRGVKTIVAGPGEKVIVPARTAHRFRNFGDLPAQIRVEVEPALHMEDLLEMTAALARDGRTLANGMPKPLDLALFLHRFEAEVRIPLIPQVLVRAVTAPLTSIGLRRGLALPALTAQRAA
ncbi:MAG: cupin domain-containing protein [Candidatus Dormibacteraceae bacterium]